MFNTNVDPTFAAENYRTNAGLIWKNRENLGFPIFSARKVILK